MVFHIKCIFFFTDFFFLFSGLIKARGVELLPKVSQVVSGLLVALEGISNDQTMNGKKCNKTITFTNETLQELYMLYAVFQLTMRFLLLMNYLKLLFHIHSNVMNFTFL